MDIAQHVSAHGMDSWEANMTYQGITFRLRRNARTGATYLCDG
jgi:hypothetical protein